MLGVNSSNTPAASTSTGSSTSTSSDALQLILSKLENVQGRLASLEKGSLNNTTSATSREAVTAEVSGDQKGDWDRLWDHHSSHRLSTEEEDQSSVHEVSSDDRSKRHRSPSPSFPERKEEELDEYPSCRQFLVTVRSLLDLPTTDDSAKGPSKIFASRDRSKRKLPVLPMSLPPVEEINARWKALEKQIHVQRMQTN